MVFVLSLCYYESGFRSYLSRNLFNSARLHSSRLFYYVFAYVCLCVCVYCSYFRLNFVFEKKNLFPSGLMCFSLLASSFHCPPLFFGHRKRHSVLTYTHTRTRTYTHTHTFPLSSIWQNGWKIEKKKWNLLIRISYHHQNVNYQKKEDVSVRKDKKVHLLRMDKCHTLCIFSYSISFCVCNACGVVRYDVCVCLCAFKYSALVRRPYRRKKIFISVKKYINFDSVSPPHDDCESLNIKVEILTQWNQIPSN